MAAASVSESVWRVGTRLIVRGRRWVVDDVSSGEDCRLLRLSEIDGHRTALSLLTPFDRPRSIERQEGVRRVRPRRWLHDLDRALLNVRPFGTLAAAPRSSIRVLPYQLEPALAMLGGLANRVLIADAVGLGKTIQAGLILRELAHNGEGFRAIILVPAGLRDQWASEMRDRFSLDCMLADAAWLRKCQSTLPADLNPWSLPGLYIASHDFVKRPESLKPLEQVVWNIAVIDEAHAATSTTDRRAALDAIASRAERVVLLTATPHQSDATEFASLCRIGRISASEDPIVVFSRSQADVGPVTRRRTIVLPVTCSQAELRMHDLLERYSTSLWREAAARGDDSVRLVSIVLRKRALSSAGSLATSILRRLDLLGGLAGPDTHQLRLPLADEDPLMDDEPIEGIGVPGLTDARREKRWLHAIAETARAAARSESKIRRLLRLLARVAEPVIVFTEYRDTLVRLHKHIAATGRPVAMIHGGLNPTERSRVPQLLRTKGTVLLATDAASEGLNLHEHCRVVVHFELPWHPMRLEQRAGRVDRIGQSKRAHEIALVASTTAERLVIAPLMLRASNRGTPRGAVVSATALTESRVAEAVMGGPAPSIGCEHTIDNGLHEIRSVDVRADALAEATRIERHRTLIARSGSSHAWARTDRPFVAIVRRTRRAHPVEPTDEVALIYSVDVEGSDGRRVHSDVVALRVPAFGGRRRGRSIDQLSELVLAFDDPLVHAQLPVLQQGIRRTIDRLQPVLLAVRTQLAQRRHLMMTARRSTAQALVQPRLFPRRTRDTSFAPVEPTMAITDTALTSRVSLVAAVVTLER
jgi:superfamily II DNA or RNA helicase